MLAAVTPTARSIGVKLRAMSLYFTPTPNPSPQGGGGPVDASAEGTSRPRHRVQQAMVRHVKFTLSWLKDHLETSASRRGAHREARLDRARCRRRRRSGGEAEGLHDRPRDRGQAASQCRQAAGLQGRHRLRRGRGRVRRAQCQDRHDRRVRAHRQLHPRHQDHARGAARARRRLPGHAGVGARARAVRRPRGHHRARRPSWRARSASATPTSWASPIPSST